jgi:nitrate/TMAO reductase-like tetraheme cytochrome c subunit
MRTTRRPHYAATEKAPVVAEPPAEAPPPRRRQTARSHSRITASVAIVVLLLAVAFVGVALYTDQPQFCATCHEMQPFHSAWTTGSHKDVGCVVCHVDPGYPARFAHKFAALSEVRAHFTGDTKFPRPAAPDITSARCTPCHGDMPEITSNGFPHGKHVSKGTCAGCHADAGHNVTDAALQAAGIFQPSAPPTIPAGAIAAVGAGSANATGHVGIPCTSCHDLAKTGCPRCHTPKHKPRGDCALCHRTGGAWKFVHPKRGVDCTVCHKRPAGHVEDGDCLRCHDKPGKTWMHTHKSGQECEPCHERPAKHRGGACASCHKQPGLNWAFSHPGSGANCRSCHEPPANHYVGGCARCHHKTGVSFAFSHPSAGEHSWRSRPCKKCHPSGTATVSCTCHGGRPPND